MIKSGIRTRLVITYVGLVFVITALAAVLLYTWVNSYYRANIEDLLDTHASSFTRFFGQYVGERADLHSVAQELATTFAANVPARVQIYGPNGEWWGDSTLQAIPVGAVPEEGLPPEVHSVLTGGETEPAGPAAGQMHVAVPLLLQGQPVGAVRLSVSLQTVQTTLRNIAWALALGVLVATAAAAALGYALARTVVGPLAELTRVAEAMGQGNLNLRAHKRLDDEIGRLAETLNRMAHDLGELDRLRNEFIASISHELRTPLTSIKGWVVTLQDMLPGEVEGRSLNPEELRPGLELIDTETDRLSGLVEELLDFGRLESGQLRIRPGALDAGALLRSLAMQMLPRAERQGIDLRAESPPALPAVHADRDRLRQVIINLIDNAFKFTPTGGSVLLTAQAVGGGVEISVSDTGPGIAPADLPRVTERFYRGQGSALTPGTGLGLAIATAIVRAHGGRLRIDSEVGRGTAVHVWMPVTGGAARA